MKRDVERETLSLARWHINNEYTVRELSKKFGIPRTTVHYRLNVDLKRYDEYLWSQCRDILIRHKAEAVTRMNKARLQHKESL